MVEEGQKVLYSSSAGAEGDGIMPLSLLSSMFSEYLLKSWNVVSSRLSPDQLHVDFKFHTHSPSNYNLGPATAFAVQVLHKLYENLHLSKWTIVSNPKEPGCIHFSFTFAFASPMLRYGDYDEHEMLSELRRRGLDVAPDHHPTRPHGYAGRGPFQPMAALQASSAFPPAYPPPLHHNSELDRLGSIFSNIKAFADQSAEAAYRPPSPTAYPSPYYDPNHHYFVSEDEPGPSHRAYGPRDGYYGYEDEGGRFSRWSEYAGNGYEPNLAARPSHRSTGVGPNEYFATRSPSPEYPPPPTAKPGTSKGPDPNFSLRRKSESKEPAPSTSVPLELNMDMSNSSLDDSLRKLRRAERERGSQGASSLHSSPLTSTASPPSTTQKKKKHRQPAQPSTSSDNKPSPSTSGTTESRKSESKDSKSKARRSRDQEEPPPEKPPPIVEKPGEEARAEVSSAGGSSRALQARLRLQEEAFQEAEAIQALKNGSKDSSSLASSGRPAFNLDGGSKSSNRETDSLRTDNSGGSSARKKGLLGQLPGFVKSKLGKNSIGSQGSSPSPKSTTIGDVNPQAVGSLPSLASAGQKLPSSSSSKQASTSNLSRHSKNTLSMSEKNVQRLFDSTDTPYPDSVSATLPKPDPAPRERDGQVEPVEGGEGGGRRSRGSGSTSLGSWNGSVEEEGWTGWRGDQWRAGRELGRWAGGSGERDADDWVGLPSGLPAVTGSAARVATTYESVEMVCQMCQGPKRPRAEYRPCPTCWNLYCPNCQWWCIMTKKQRCVQCYYNDAPIQADNP